MEGALTPQNSPGDFNTPQDKHKQPPLPEGPGRAGASVETVMEPRGAWAARPRPRPDSGRKSSSTSAQNKWFQDGVCHRHFPAVFMRQGWEQAPWLL